MARKRYTAEQIIGHLRQTEILISEGKTIIVSPAPSRCTFRTFHSGAWSLPEGGFGEAGARGS